MHRTRALTMQTVEKIQGADKEEVKTTHKSCFFTFFVSVTAAIDSLPCS